MDAQSLREQLEEAIRRRNVVPWMVHSDYTITAGAIVPNGELNTLPYFPIAVPAVLQEVGRLVIGDEKGVLAFARRWGLFGYSTVVANCTHGERLPPLADPLAWFWAHVNGIQCVLRLDQLRRRGNLKAIGEYLETLTISQTAKDTWQEANLFLSAYTAFGLDGHIDRLFGPTAPFDRWFLEPALVYGQRHRLGEPWLRDWLVDPFTGKATTSDPREEAAICIIITIMSDNLAGAHRAIGWSGGDGSPLTLGNRAPSLIDAIYWHLAELITGERVEDCAACHMPFVPRTRGQRFCSRAPWEKESRCATKTRQQRHRGGALLDTIS